MTRRFFHYFTRLVALVAWFFATVFVLPAIALGLMGLEGVPGVPIAMGVGFLVFASGWAAWIDEYGQGVW